MRGMLKNLALILCIVGMTSQLQAGVAQNFQEFCIDFQADDFGTPLVNGQHIDTFNGPGTLEFGNIMSITSNLAEQHLGAAIFDSTPGGVNSGPGAPDPDLLVDLGNILILQDAENPQQTVPGIFDLPDDDFPGGTITVQFNYPVYLTSIDLVDIDQLLGAEVTLFDSLGNIRNYDVSNNWTFDINVDGPSGYDTLDLTTLAPQQGEGGGTAIATEIAPFGGFNPQDVVAMQIVIEGSGGIDNIKGTVIPEPVTMTLLGLGGLGILSRRKKI